MAGEDWQLALAPRSKGEHNNGQSVQKILLVEDNEMNRDMLSRRLKRNGYDVVIAIDGQQGVDMAASEAPDLILMDMSLPVIDGWVISPLPRLMPGWRRPSTRISVSRRPMPRRLIALTPTGRRGLNSLSPPIA